MEIVDILKILGLSLLIIFCLSLFIWPFISSMLERTEKKLSIFSFILLALFLLSLFLCVFLYSQYSLSRKEIDSLQSQVDSINESLMQVESSAYDEGYSAGKQEGYDHYASESFDYRDGFEDGFIYGESMGYEEASLEYENSDS